MAGVGKSHIAKKISAISNYEYIETDKLIAEQANEEGMRYLDLSDDDQANAEFHSDGFSARVDVALKGHVST